MTEVWKSNPHYFCEICRVWMNDNPAARATHEKGSKHQDLLARKLRDMRHKADADKRNEILAAKTMSSIEARAQKQYEQDLKAQTSGREELTGKWEDDAESGHMYNARHRYYYDKATKMYYGGEPPAWTIKPSIPPEALFKEASSVNPPTTTGANPTQKKYSSIRVGSKSGNSHPLANLGGYQMPLVGKIGGVSNFVGEKQTNSSAKRGRDDKTSNGVSKKNISKEEEEALKRREAARARVQQRTMNAFGLN